MQWFLLVLGVLVGWWLIGRVRLYGRLFAPAHYRELNERLVSARAAALARVDDELNDITPEDPRAILTSAGLVVFVTIRRDGDVYVHHISLSLAGRPTTHALGRTFTVFVAERLGWDLSRAAFVFSSLPVFHGELHLDEAAQQAWAPRAVATELGDDVHARAFARREAVTFAPLQLPPA